MPNSDSGAWLPKAKEMMPFWWYFQPAFNCPHEVERVGRFNDGGKVRQVDQDSLYLCLCIYISYLTGTKRMEPYKTARID